jgi:hypothetical protein
MRYVLRVIHYPYPYPYPHCSVSALPSPLLLGSACRCGFRWIAARGVALCIHRERRYRSNIEEVWYAIPPSHR